MPPLRWGNLVAMQLPPPEHAKVAIGAVLGAFAPSGGLDELQASVLESLSLALFDLDLRADPIQALSAVEFLEQSAPAFRHQAVCVMAVLEMVASPLSPAAADGVARYAHSLGVEHGALRAASDRADGHLRMMHADFERSSWYTRTTIHGMLHGQFRELAKSKVAYQGIAASPKIAKKWLALRECPEGSWGRGLADFYDQHDFPFPGERRGIYELGACHDFVHVLADYETTPEGELDVFGFIAAAMPGDEGLILLSVTFGLFQNDSIHRASGRRIRNARADTMADVGAVDRFTQAVHRGSMCTADVMSVDHFALAPLPLAEVREMFNVVPLEGPL